MKAKIDSKITRSCSLLCEKLNYKGKHLFDRFGWRCDELLESTAPEVFFKLFSTFLKFLKEYSRHPEDAICKREIVELLIVAFYPEQKGKRDQTEFIANSLSNFVNKEESEETKHSDESIACMNVAEIALATPIETRIHLFADGSVFTGEWMGDKRHGSGTFRCANGGLYVGEWKNNKKNGVGTLWYANGSLYEGEFKNDKRHGFGVQLYKKVSGQDTDDRMVTKHGGVYAGEWRNGIRRGHGTFLYVNGSVYMGMWKSGKRNGRGIFRDVNGAMYDGEWLDGNEHGIGTYWYPDGAVYEGEWQNGYRHGRGKFEPAGNDVTDPDSSSGSSVSYADELYREQSLQEDVFVCEDGTKISLKEANCAEEILHSTDWEESGSSSFLKNDFVTKLSMNALSLPPAIHSVVSTASMTSDATTCESLVSTNSVPSHLEINRLEMVRHIVVDNSQKYKVVCALPYAHLRIDIYKGIRSMIRLYEEGRTTEALYNLIIELIRVSHVMRKQDVRNSNNSDFLLGITLVSQCADADLVNSRDPTTLDSLLHALCKLNHLEAIRMLLNNPFVDVDLRDRHHCTSLVIVAMTNQDIDATRELLNRNADPLMSNKDGLSAMSYAAIASNASLWSELKVANQSRQW